MTVQTATPFICCITNLNFFTSCLLFNPGEFLIEKSDCLICTSLQVTSINISPSSWAQSILPATKGIGEQCSQFLFPSYIALQIYFPLSYLFQISLFGVLFSRSPSTIGPVSILCLLRTAGIIRVVGMNCFITSFFSLFFF